MVLVLCGILVGCLLPIQTAANTRLKLSVGSPVSATFYSFLVGFVLLATAAFVTTGAMLPSGVNYGGAPWWIWLGGLAGVGMLLGNILLFPRLGALPTVVLPIAGQIVSGLVIDQFGLFRAPQSPLTLPRVVGALLVIVGVLVAVGVIRFSFSLSTPTPASLDVPSPGRQVWLWRALGLFAGLLIATQAAINSQLAHLLGSPVRAASISFCVGASVLAVLVLVGRLPLRVKRLEEAEGARNPWWMWIGGVIGACFVTTQAILVAEIGTGMTVIATLMGMMTGSLLVDRFGLLGAPRVPVTKAKLAGLAIMLIGVAMVRLVG